MSEFLLTKKTYGMVIKGLERCRKSFERDRIECPNIPPADYRIELEYMVEDCVRKSREKYSEGLAYRVLCYLTERGLLVRYLGGFTFPSAEPLPTEKAVHAWAKKELSKVGIHT